MRFLSHFCAISIACMALFASPANAQQPPPMIYAAASFAPVLAALIKDSDCPDVLREAKIVIGGSSALARQIEAGAPADVFVSADKEWMDWAQERKLVKAEARMVVAANTLVLIAGAATGPLPTPAPGFPLREALGSGRLAIGQPETVPVGRYAKQALTALGVWDHVKDKVAATDSVTTVVALVARGEAPLGIVYATDIMKVAGVRAVGPFPAASHADIAYHAAPLAQARHPRAAEVGAALTSAIARRVYAAHGFLPVK